MVGDGVFVFNSGHGKGVIQFDVGVVRNVGSTEWQIRGIPIGGS